MTQQLITLRGFLLIRVGNAHPLSPVRALFRSRCCRLDELFTAPKPPEILGNDKTSSPALCPSVFNYQSLSLIPSPGSARCEHSLVPEICKALSAAFPCSSREIAEVSRGFRGRHEVLG